STRGSVTARDATENMHACRLVCLLADRFGQWFHTPYRAARGHGLVGSYASHPGNQEQQADEEHDQQEVDVDVGEDLGLVQRVVVEHGEGAALGGEAVRA